MARTVVTKFAANGSSIASQDVFEYAYNETGLRVSQSDGGVTTVYLLDLQNPTGYAQVLEERDAAGNVSKTYTLGHDVLAQATARQVLYLLTDGHGSTRAVYDLAALLANPQNPAVAILQRFA